MVFNNITVFRSFVKILPSIGLVVAGDVAYNDVHQYLAESNAQTRNEWIYERGQL